MNKYLADTTLLVDHLRGQSKAKLFLENHTPYISTVTIAELIQGSRDKKELQGALKLIHSLPEVEINKKISSKAIQLLTKFHLSHGLLFLDSLIASTAIDNNFILITGNIKHFTFIRELQILSQLEGFL